MPDRPVIPLLSVRNLSVTFPGPPFLAAVDNISFTLHRGETMAIVGESGSGKSLTAFAISGLLPKEAAIKGEIMLQDEHNKISLQDLTLTQWQQLRGNRIGIVFQEPMSALNPVMKIGIQLQESILVNSSYTKKEAFRQAISWLKKVQLPDPEILFHRYPHQLSGGQKQRVMIAMAMSHNPDLLIADEPTTALDVTVQKEIIGLMQSLQKESGTAMIFITHDLALASETADRLLVMYKGRIMESGSIQHVLHHPQHPYTRALIACRPDNHAKGKPLPVVADFWNPETDSELATEKNLAFFKKEPAVHSGRKAVLLKVQDLDIQFVTHRSLLGKPRKSFPAVNRISFDLHKGETLGLVGESGCGKSTLSRSLIGLLPVHGGHIWYDGADLAYQSQEQWKSTRKKIQMIFQDPYASLNPRLTIGTLLSEPLKVHKIVPEAHTDKEVARLLDLVQLPASAAQRYPHQFSGGQRQRICIARALAMQPELLICDESVSALDVSIQAQILNLLQELQQRLQLTYLFISHDLSVVHYISDQIIVMQKGSIVESGDADSIIMNPHQAYTQKLVQAMPQLS